MENSVLIVLDVMNLTGIYFLRHIIPLLSPTASDS